MKIALGICSAKNVLREIVIIHLRRAEASKLRSSLKIAILNSPAGNMDIAERVFFESQCIFFFSNATSGCPISLTSQELEIHEKECQFQKIKCFYDGCSSLISPQDFEIVCFHVKDKKLLINYDMSSLACRILSHRMSKYRIWL